MVMAQSLFMTLKQAQPNSVIDVLAPGWTAPLIERMPEVRRAIKAPFDHGRFDLAGRWRLGRTLRAERYDRAIVLPNSWKSALVPWFAGIPRRTGWKGEMRFGLLNDMRALDKQRLPMMVDRFNALAFDGGRIAAAADFPAPHPNPHLVVDTAQAERTRDKFGLESERPVLALCPGAEFGPSKRWPDDKYASSCRRADCRGLAGLAVRLGQGRGRLRKHSGAAAAGRAGRLPHPGRPNVAGRGR